MFLARLVDLLLEMEKYFNRNVYDARPQAYRSFNKA